MLIGSASWFILILKYLAFEKCFFGKLEARGRKSEMERWVSFDDICCLVATSGQFMIQNKIRTSDDNFSKNCNDDWRVRKNFWWNFCDDELFFY